ncbi:sensor histidine kinase [Corynebacterium accolens]|uniref:sensor histidine kinase n=1 Tax=Corynebacterium accolens TaxID=38284 RepID=UPI00254B60A4|nr:histidine kinase [Corynebacterium accolens]MDK8470948.1 histidine kinase [Corynebacterium accolens]MDK8617029.1 histidine kinase [Corynebacterium accolens]
MSKLWPDRLRDWIGPPWRIIIPVFFGVLLPNAANFLHTDSPFQAIVAVLYTVGIPLALWLHPKLQEKSIFFIAGTMTLCIFTPLASLENFHAPIFAYTAFLIGTHSRKRLRYIWLAWIALGSLAGTTASLFGEKVFAGSDIGLGDATMSPLLVYAGTVLLGWPVLGFFYLLGTNNRKRREGQQLLIERAEMAGAVERNRIAREMHDIVAHNLAGVIALADGARFAAAKDPKVATEALDTIASTSRESLKQMRSLLSVLREEDARGETKAPGTSDIAGLFSEARRAGFDITVYGMEKLPADSDELYQFTIYRIVQEMLTNMLKYSSQNRGTLRFRSDRSALVIEGHNPMAQPDDDHSPGYGLIGMKERVKAYGGSVSTKAEDGTFAIIVEVPHV